MLVSDQGLVAEHLRSISVKIPFVMIDIPICNSGMQDICNLRRLSPQPRLRTLPFAVKIIYIPLMCYVFFLTQLLKYLIAEFESLRECAKPSNITVILFSHYSNYQ